jgi:protein tyrosine phosphatase (PTP) superfamily phosphohydrolase (DUF442 family)
MTKLNTALALALLLTGCGSLQTPVVRVAPAVQSAAPASAQAAAPTITVTPEQMGPAQPEAQPTGAQLASLELTSPDELLDNAPLEPGVSAFSFGIHPPDEDLGNFGEVEDTLWRGARPTDKGLEQLAAKGVKTIVNLENDKKAVEHEGAWATAHGIRFVSIPLSVILPPKGEKIDQWLALANDPAARPLYFHCMQGRDRTGTAAFTYRVSHDHWKFDQAYSEMKSFHFHTYLLGLQGYIRHFASAHS